MSAVHSLLALGPFLKDVLLTFARHGTRPLLPFCSSLSPLVGDRVCDLLDHRHYNEMHA